MPYCAMAAASMACMRATDTVRGDDPDAKRSERLAGGLGCLMEEPTTDYFDGGVAAAAGAAPAEASAFSSLAALRALIFICLILGNPKTERPSVHSPCSIRWRTRSWRFITLRATPEPLLARNDEWMDMCVHLHVCAIDTAVVFRWDRAARAQDLQGANKTPLVTLFECRQLLGRMRLGWKRAKTHDGIAVLCHEKRPLTG